MRGKNQKNRPLNKKVVFEAADRLAASLKMPTIKELRTQLGGCGSETTLHKYLNQWKIELLKMASNGEGESVRNHEELGSAKEDVKALAQALENERAEKKTLSAELIKSEKENLALKLENQRLTKDLKAVATEHKTLTIKSEHLEKLCQAITEERKAMAAAVLQDQNHKIAALQAELRQVNQENLEQIKKMGFAGDEALLHEKLKVINLEDKVQALTEQVKALEKTLSLEKTASESLRQHIKAQKAMTQKMFSPTPLQQPTVVKEG